MTEGALFFGDGKTVTLYNAGPGRILNSQIVLPEHCLSANSLVASRRQQR
jgi:hypothetical protein